jgi:hypothetical protein
MFVSGSLLNLLLMKETLPPHVPDNVTYPTIRPRQQAGVELASSTGEEFTLFHGIGFSFSFKMNILYDTRHV